MRHVWQETQEVRAGKSLFSLVPRWFNLTNPSHSIRARCWIQVPSSNITPHSTLFPTPRTLTMAMIPRMLRYVQPLSDELQNRLIMPMCPQHVDIPSPPTFTTNTLQREGANSPPFDFDGFYHTQFSSSSPGSLVNDDDDTSSCTPPITEGSSSGDCDSDSCEIWEDHGGLDEYVDFYDDQRYVQRDQTRPLPSSI